MPYDIGQDDGGEFIVCLNEGCEAYGRKSYSMSDIENLYCSCCGFHEVIFSIPSEEDHEL